MRAFYSKFATFLEQRYRFDARYFLSGGFWLTLTQAIVVLAGIITTSLFAHYLSENDYGIYRYLIGLAVIFSSFSLTGLGQSILQTAAQKYYGFYKETIRINLIYSSAITLFSLAGTIYYYINENNTLALGCLIIAILQPIINAFQNTQAFLQGSRRFREATITQSIKVLTVAVTSITALYLTESILILFFVYVATNSIVNLAFHLIYIPKHTIPTPPEIIKKYISYTKHTSIRNIIGNVAYRLDSVIIFTYLGATELAIYTITNVVPEQVKASIKNLATLLIPKYANLKDLNLAKKFIFKRSIQLFAIFSVITILYIIASPVIYKLLFSKYGSAIFLSQIVALSFPAMIAIFL
jgi:O-antigen/teichoic acid export membrane protein